MPTVYYFYLSAFVFVVGLVVILTKRHLIGVLVGIELLFNAATINFVGFSSAENSAQGQVAALFVIVIATAETAIGLAIAYQLYKYLQTDDLTHFSQLKEEA